jgi:hypothetical protein
MIGIGTGALVGLFIGYIGYRFEGIIKNGIY